MPTPKHREITEFFRFGTVAFMEKRILGLDPGLATLGFGAIDISESQKQSATVVDFGIIQTPAKTELPQRLQTLYEDLHDLMKQFQPQFVAVEKLFFYRMGNTILVAQARGIIMLVLAQHNLNFVEFIPGTVKQTLTGYGNAEKEEVQDAVARELQLDSIPKPDDAADALALAVTAWLHL